MQQSSVVLHLQEKVQISPPKLSFTAIKQIGAVLIRFNSARYVQAFAASSLALGSLL